MLDEIYIEEKDNEVVVSIEYLVGGREAETLYSFKNEMARKFKEVILLENKTLEESCEEILGINLNETKLKEICDKNGITYTKSFWVA